MPRGIRRIVMIESTRRLISLMKQCKLAHFVSAIRVDLNVRKSFHFHIQSVFDIVLLGFS